MRSIALILISYALLACSENVPTMPSPVAQETQAIIGEAQSGMVVIGTLAPFGSWEFELAPTYTRNASLRQRAANALRNKKISLEVAKSILTITDKVRALLDMATRETTDGKPTPSARTKLNDAAALIAQGERQLEGTQR